jgi:hypothetical protein
MGHNDRPRDGHDDNPKDDKPFDAVTRLFIRDNIMDDGTEPSSQPAWLSPDIIVTPPGGSAGGDPVVGQPNTISVTVRNGGGMNALGVWVDAFACDPTTGWTPALAESIGGAYVDIAPTSLAVANLVWTPPPGPLHRCLMARASLLIPNDTYTNPQIFDVLGDRHIAQHNVNLVVLAQNQMTITYGFLAVNGGAEAGEFLLLAEHVAPTPQAMRMLAGGLGCGLAQWGQTPLRDFELTLGGRIVPGQDERGERRTGVLPQPLREFPARTAFARRQPVAQRLKLETGEVRQAFLTVARNPDTRPGDLHVIEVTQIDARTERITGGLWLALRH